MQDEKQAALEAHVEAVIAADNISEAVGACSRYPRIENRKLSQFEDDVRDWGYGIAFGLAKSEQTDDEPDELIAERAYKVARKCFAGWNGGDIENPAVVRERAVRAVIREFEAAHERAWKAGRHPKTEEMMTSGLRDALSEFEIVMGGQPS